jgi:hypothetical protein
MKLHGVTSRKIGTLQSWPLKPQGHSTERDLEGTGRETVDWI